MKRGVIFSIAIFLFVTAVAMHAAQSSSTVARSVWDGAYTIEQADRGRTAYAGSCAECHGAELEGREGTRLVGDKFWTDWGDQSVGDLLAYISKNMPASEDGSTAGTLSPTTYADIVAHILRANGFPAGARELSAATGTGVQIMRKDGPGELPASTLAHVVGCLAPRAADGSWRVVRASRPVRITAGGPRPDPNAPLGDREFALKFVLTPLAKFVGHRVSVTGLLLGAGGAEGLNVSTIESVSAACD